MRTTINIDDPILKEIKSLQKKERKSLGRIVSDLLALGLRARNAAKRERKSSRWIVREMAARVDLADTDAVYAAMEGDAPPSRRAARS
jgi:mRNA-degrading endonuclease RelE of RelBE toxin-antitoxin system